MTTAAVLGPGVGVAALGVGVAALGVGVAAMGVRVAVLGVGATALGVIVVAAMGVVTGVGVAALVAAPPLKLGLTADDVAPATLPVGEEVIPQAARRAEAAPSMTSRESPRRARMP
ncbi:MAG: hypothetical protein ABSE52_10510 [Candidatus Dormibacteria bacterium]|jgi:hypothetical protein